MHHRSRWISFVLVGVSLLVGRSNAVDLVEQFPIDLPGDAITGVCFGKGALFAVSRGNSLRKYDPTNGEVLQIVDPLLSDLEVPHLHGLSRGDDGTFWVGDVVTLKLYQLRFEGYSLVSAIDAPPGSPAFGLTFDHALLWVGHHSDGPMTPVRGIDPATGEIVAMLEFGAIDVHGLVWVGGYLWVLDNMTNVVYKVTGDGEIEETFKLPPGYWGSLAYDGAQFWTNNSLAFFTIDLPAPLPCPADLDGDGTVGATDLLSLLAQWGADPGGPPDFNGDGTVGAADLLVLLANWGPCP